MFVLSLLYVWSTFQFTVTGLRFTHRCITTLRIESEWEKERTVKWFIDRVASPLTIIVCFCVHRHHDDNVGTDSFCRWAFARLTADFLHICVFERWILIFKPKGWSSSRMHARKRNSIGMFRRQHNSCALILIVQRESTQYFHSSRV